MEKIFKSYKNSLKLTREVSMNSIITLGSTGKKTKKRQNSSVFLKNQPLMQ